ncbi:3-hydroxyisobutyryl-CoA hydrolase [Geomicrobium sp. JCM 19039]|uniref:3-hydroxyisobutyryl-CoA hydrolase n=1 Tax=Geomicrobium sp. JCM 19039 TaxID=1460636 RepID=UPI00045F111A|nr:3-hydroxyisobutyryl-CoA hydrolase [Geomicrobium sp. JCM 19039]GAK10407.1 3-hydroxyisobutyryl-CoA hydrolase [Geomicrobium sp. JCM 19039]
MSVNVHVNDQGLATLELDRPKAIGSLNHEMVQTIQEQLEHWKNDDHVKVILLKGNSEKGFCAGGDIKTLANANKSDEDFERARQFFLDEYALDADIANYKKPIVALLHGVVMGGGVGLSQGASHRIVTHNTKWAMPEMNIGFFPDVGASYYLNQAPGYSGTYLALTAKVIPAEDVLYIGAADFYVDDVTRVEETLRSKNWMNIDAPRETLDQLLKDVSEEPKPSALAAKQTLIDEFFHLHQVEDIVKKLRDDGGEFATKTADTLESKSPVSLKVTLRHMLESTHQPLEKVLEADATLAINFLKADDFYRGVESVLIKKDNNPQYTYRTLEEVREDVVDQYFK